VRHPITTSHTSIIKVKKKIIYLLIMILLTNCLTWLLLMPYSQKTANSHINSGPLFGTLYYVFAAITLIFGINISIKQNDIKLFLISIALGGTFTYWGYNFHSLYCQGCENSG